MHGTKQNGTYAAYCHEHEHHCVISDAAGQIWSILNENSKARGSAGVDMIISDAAGADAGYPCAMQCMQIGGGNPRFMADADAAAPQIWVSGILFYRGFCENRFYAKTGRKRPKCMDFFILAVKNRESHVIYPPCCFTITG